MMESGESGTNKGKRPTKSDENKSCDSAANTDKSVADKGPSKGKRLKKDDSGISVMPESDNSDDSGPSCSGDSKNTSVPEINSPDSGNVESSCASTSKSGKKRVKKENSLNSDLSDSEDVSDVKLFQSSSSSDCDNTKRSKSKRKISSDDSSDDDSDGKEEKKYDPTPLTSKPVHRWSAPMSVIGRQYGVSSKYSPDLFRHHCYGSMHVVERLELMYKMKKHDGCVNALNFNSTGTKLVSGSDDLDVIVWDWTISEPLLTYNSGHISNVFTAKFVPQSGDCHIVTCARDGQVRLAELSSDGTCKGTRKLGQHKGAAHKLAVQKDSPHIFLSCAEDGTVYLFDLRVERGKDNPQKLITFTEDSKKIPIYSIAINPLKPNEYVVGGRSPFVKIYDSRYTSESAAWLKSFCPAHLVNSELRANVTSAVYSYNGEEILASYNEDIYLFSNYETDSSKYLHRYRGHRNSQTIKGVNFFGSKSEFIVSGSDCGYIFFWDKESEHVVKYMYGDEMGVVNCIEPHPHMPVVATSGLDDDIKIWVPSCENEPDLSKLREHLISNQKEMETERLNECSDVFVDQTILFLMQHLSRARARQRPVLWNFRDDQEENTSSSDSDAGDDNSDIRPSLQCNQS